MGHAMQKNSALTPHEDKQGKGAADRPSPQLLQYPSTHEAARPRQIGRAAQSPVRPKPVETDESAGGG